MSGSGQCSNCSEAVVFIRVWKTRMSSSVLCSGLCVDDRVPNNLGCSCRLDLEYMWRSTAALLERVQVDTTTINEESDLFRISICGFIFLIEVMANKSFSSWNDFVLVLTALSFRSRRSLCFLSFYVEVVKHHLYVSHEINSCRSTPVFNPGTLSSTLWKVSTRQL